MKITVEINKGSGTFVVPDHNGGAFVEDLVQLIIGAGGWLADCQLPGMIEGQAPVMKITFVPTDTSHDRPTKTIQKSFDGGT